MKTRSILFIFLAMLFYAPLKAQVAVQNNGIVYVSTGTDILFINGSYTNASTAALTNNGALHIKQDLTNNQASMAVGTGTLYLNGTSLQTVDGSQVFKTFNLTTSNSAGITLNNDLSVSGAHLFSAGIITTSATPNYLIYQAGSSYSGDADSRHVNGWVKKFGSTAFTFPVGNASLERTIGVTGLSGTSEFNAKYNAPTPNPTQLQYPLVSLDGSEYWILNKVSGGTASVAMNWDDSKVPFPDWVLSDVRVAGYNGSLWTNQGGSATGNVATTGAVTSNSISSFNLFTFGSQSYVVPLTMISFTANEADGYVHIEWKTASEYNVDHFSVERSNDGINFFGIGQVPARNSGGIETYSLDDKTPVNNIAYYRLRSIDIDGKSSLSAVVIIRDNQGGNQLNLVINPVHDLVALQADLRLTGIFDYRITTATGQFLQQGKIAISNGGRYQVPLSRQVKPGAYVMLVSNGEKTFTFKIIVN